MSSPSVNSSLHPARLAGALAISILFAGCVTGAGGAGSSTPGESPSASTSGSPSAGPSGSSSANGFYLRVWQTQALAPQNTFDWLPVVTISDGKFIDGRVAVPAIYPGPLWIGLSVRTISAKGIDAIVAEARKQGLLDTKVDFADQAVPGAVLGHIQLIVDGKTYDLTGDPDALTRCRCIPAPGSSAAYAAFWQKLSDLDANRNAWPFWRRLLRSRPAASPRMKSRGRSPCRSLRSGPRWATTAAAAASSRGPTWPSSCR
jgi:hypothetical protein